MKGLIITYHYLQAPLAGAKRLGTDSITPAKKTKAMANSGTLEQDYTIQTSTDSMP